MSTSPGYELHGTAVRVFGLHPGLVRSPMTEALAAVPAPNGGCPGSHVSSCQDGG
jgi:NAD(P)-dependent dehydrogenase (short-subunit alcohol dehydrogenase family)